MSHESAAGALCQDDGSGICSMCGVALTLCGICDGRGYHRAGCYESDEYLSVASTFRVDPVLQASEDFADACTQGLEIRAVAYGPLDDALVNAMNRTWILDAAGADMRADHDAEWERIGAVWANAYNVAFRHQARIAIRARVRVGTNLVVVRDSESLGVDEGYRCAVIWTDGSTMDITIPLLDTTIAGVSVTHADLAVDE